MEFITYRVELGQAAAEAFGVCRREQRGVGRSKAGIASLIVMLCLSCSTWALGEVPAAGNEQRRGRSSSDVSSSAAARDGGTAVSEVRPRDLHGFSAADPDAGELAGTHEGVGAGEQFSTPVPDALQHDPGLPKLDRVSPGRHDIFRAVVHLRTPRDWYRARRLGLNALQMGSHEHEVSQELLNDLLMAGIAFDIVGGTTLVEVPSNLLRSAEQSMASSLSPPIPPREPEGGSGTLWLDSGPIDIPIEDNTGNAQFYRLQNLSAPSNAEVTGLRYRLRISDEGNGAFYCGDYEIWLFSGNVDWELRVYDNLGGATDGGFDDDTADDQDIYLNFRSTSAFNGETPDQYWGVIVWDNLSGDDGKLDYIQFEVDWEVPASGDIYEPDNSSSQAYEHPHNFTSAFRSIDPATDQDWIRITLSQRSDVIIETIGPAGDTRLWLYNSSLSQIAFDDDGGTGTFSRIERSGANALDAGVYYAQVDEFGNNNLIPDYGIELTVNTAALPDLTAPNFSFTTWTPTEGDAFFVEQAITNSGAGSAGASHARFYLSIDNDFDVSDDYEILPEKSVPALGPGGVAPTRWDFTFPDILDSPTYLVWLVVVVDSRNEVSETNENNVYKSNDYLTVGEAFDLVANDVFFRDQPGNVGNIVTAPAPGAEVYAHFTYTVDSESVLSGRLWDILLDGSLRCFFDGTSGLGNRVGWCNSPWTATPGSHTLSGVLDPNGAFDETNEGNNTASRNYTIDQAVDLAATDVFFRTAINGGDRVDNPTVGQELYLHITYDVSSTSDVSGRIWQLELDGSVRCSVDTTVSNGSWIGWCNSPWTATAGAHGLVGVLDPLGTIAESNEGNNTTSRNYSIQAGGPEIHVAPLTLDFGESVKDPIYIELDWMDGGDHTHRPSQAVIDEVVATFAAAGFSVNIEVSNAIPHQEFVDVVGSPSTSPDIQALMNTHFQHIDDDRYYYSLWVHSFSDSGVETSFSGVGDLPGRVHLVSLGSFDGQVGTFSNQVGTFVHEFGHNLGQRHGGGDHSNYKPNYLSVMNYHYQLEGIGSSALALGFATTVTGFDDFSYSHGLLPSLNENALDESVGIGLGRAVDWNCDGDSTDNGVARDIQEANHCAANGTRGTLSDFDNWADIESNIATLALPGRVAPGPSPSCIDFETYRPLAERVAKLRSEGLLPPAGPRVRDKLLDSARSFTISNVGDADLNITAISLDIASSWISWEPQAPFTVAPGGAQQVYVYVDQEAAPQGQTTRQLRVFSNDGDENPYPGGVNLIVNSLADCTLTTSAAPSVGGFTTGDATVGCGTTMTAKAFPADGYDFVNWTQGGSVVSTLQDYTFVLGTHRSLVANFSDGGGNEDPIFSDGFESGGFGAWSAVVP